ncbi:ankyrin repeat and LEM domain-containing protein 1 homolog [Drosophila obscura]|uniref:ankyrin repeat and LEM domain-containing protein 1 homolog n=1 Tax=Drosophila obscura TaxID=7282 RepID=UPI001BB2882B|nr:ankyrin repeat and LEM domain-containing protein 1 homolog [Drosophila obscura]
MEQRANFLALTLLDALEDENEADILSMLDRNVINAGIVPCDRGLAPLHYVCGMRNEQLARRILEKFLESPDLDVNALCDGQTTALHIASIYGRVELVRMLLQRGARADLPDDENKLPVHYAIEECHFEVLQLLRDHIFREKHKQKNLRLPQHQAVASPTPNQILKYNYDVTSPYYINITHRRHKPQPKFPDIPMDATTLPDEQSVNLFTLTEAHLTQLLQSQCQEDPDQPKRRSIIESWREKVERSRARQSLMHKYDKHVEAIVEEALAQEDFNYERHMQKKLREEDGLAMEMEMQQQQIDDAAAPNRQIFQQLVEQVSQAQVIEPEPDNSFVTAREAEELPGHSPRPTDEYFLQIKEAYVHTDDENGLVFYEAKFLQNDERQAKRFAERGPQPEQQQRQQQLDSTVSTNLTLPLDYETDALRRELTQLGASVGPITKTTKRLYIKQLIKYRRNTDALLAAQKHAQESQIRYSVELHRTLRSPEDFERISEFMPQEAASSEHFATAPIVKRTLREGHLKQSFIYMLIDPRISRNLPGESTFLDKFSIWQRFLDSIFYVGKGKSSRPYAHLYDAMRQHTRLNQKRDNGRERTEKAERKGGFRTLQPDVFKSPPARDAKLLGSKKLERILEIWQSESGVVCLHVFHNIMPIDAYTREASIIDAMGLGHLTNLKRGDYYGPAQSWTMKQRKHLGIALLYKAMHIYLAEGESQLSPSDLI